MQIADSGSRPIATRMVLRFVFTAVFPLAILFIAAGALRWWVGWAYVAVTLAVIAVSRVWIILKNPDLAVERAQAGAQKDIKSWDKVLVIAATWARTILEDRTLQEELAGYKEYARRVRHRLLPGVW